MISVTFCHGCTAELFINLKLKFTRCLIIFNLYFYLGGCWQKKKCNGLEVSNMFHNILSIFRCQLSPHLCLSVFVYSLPLSFSFYLSLSIYLSLYLPLCLFLCLSLSVSVCLSLSVSVSLSVIKDY